MNDNDIEEDIKDYYALLEIPVPEFNKPQKFSNQIDDTIAEFLLSLKDESQ